MRRISFRTAAVVTLAVIALASLFVSYEARAAQTTVAPANGGTGIGTSAGNIGKCLGVSSESPFAYTFFTCAGGGGSTFGYPFPGNATSTNINFSGGLTGNLTGNANTATKLLNARTINNVSFDGTGNITLNAASSTLLGDANNWSVLNKFLTITATGATTTSFENANLASTTGLVVSSAGGTPGCATFSATGLISNTGVACGTGGGGTFSFTPFAWGNATGTTLGLQGGFISNASSTFTSALFDTNLAGGNVYIGQGGQVLSEASSSLFGYTPLNPTRNINTNFPLGGGGPLTSDLTLGFNGLGTSTALTQGQVPYVTGPNTFGQIATGTVNCTGGASCASFTVLGGNSTINVSGASGSGLGTTTPWNGGQVAMVVNNGTVQGVSTSTLSLTNFPANIPNTLGAVVGGSNTTWNWWGLATSSALTTNALPIVTGANTLGNSSLSQIAGTTFVNGVPTLDGGGDFLGNIFQSSPVGVITQPTATSTAIVGSLVQAGGVLQTTSSFVVTPAQFCGTGEVVVASSTPADVTITVPNRTWLQNFANLNPTVCSPTAWPSSFAEQFIFNNSTHNVYEIATDTSEVIEYAPATPSVLAPGQSWDVKGQLSNEYNYPQGFGGSNSTIRIYTASYSTNGPLYASSTSIGVGTTSPYATLAINANTGGIQTTLFAIGSSTASGNSNLFSISNTGTITTTLGNCSGTNALRSLSGVISCGTVTFPNVFPFTPNSWGNATGTTLGLQNGFISNASSTIASTLWDTLLSAGLLYLGQNGQVQTAATSSLNASITGSASSVANALTINNSGSGVAPGGTYNGSSATTLSYNSIGAGGLGATNTWTGPNAFAALTATNATTTGSLYVTGPFASTTNLFANGLVPCTGSNFLQWASGAFGCAAPSVSSNVGNWFTPTNYGNATSTTLGFNSGFLSTASSTINGTLTQIGNVKQIAGQSAQSIASTTTPGPNYIVNWNNGNVDRILLSQNSTIDINATSSNPIDGGFYGIKACENVAGGSTLTFVNVGALRWGSQGTTSIPTTANTCSYIGMQFDALSGLYSVLGSTTAISNL